jgi:hypothetical protein
MRECLQPALLSGAFEYINRLERRKKMKSQVIAQCLLSVAVSMIVLCAGAWAGPGFYEDFRDGDPADGSPVNWVPTWGWDAGHRDLLSDGMMEDPVAIG